MYSYSCSLFFWGLGPPTQVLYVDLWFEVFDAIGGCQQFENDRTLALKFDEIVVGRPTLWNAVVGGVSHVPRRRKLVDVQQYHGHVFLILTAPIEVLVGRR